MVENFQSHTKLKKFLGESNLCLNVSTNIILFYKTSRYVHSTVTVIFCILINMGDLV